MKRAVDLLSRKSYDVAVIGGGIYGAFVAWDAALRGLSVALVDKGDFGGATSANNQKIIHGGFRYLQHADFKRMRESIRERSTLMRIAPHLVSPMPFLIPLYGGLMGNRLAMAIALKLNDLVGLDRNRRLDPEQQIASGRVISKEKCLALCPGLDPLGLKGGALFYDAQVHSPHRLTLSVLQSAARGGADLANYTRVIGLVRDKNTVKGFKAQDLVGGKMLEVRARIVVNCAGPWVDEVSGLMEDGRPSWRNGWFKAVVLVTRRLFNGIAVGVPCKEAYRDADEVIEKGHRYLFITPWRGASLVGTYYAPYSGKPGDLEVSDVEIDDFIDRINRACPSAGLKRRDVHWVYSGLLPRGDGGNGVQDIQYSKRYRIHDHDQEDGIRRLVSVVGVKYTTAREVAAKTVDLVLRKLGRDSVRCQTDVTPVCGGEMKSLRDLAARAIQDRPEGVPPGVIQHLISNYGSAYSTLLHYLGENAAWGNPIDDTSPVIQAQVIHAVREEMAQKLADVIFRRTELGSTCPLNETGLQTCAMIMGEESGWDPGRMQKEIEEVKETFSKMGCVQWTPMTAASLSS